MALDVDQIFARVRSCHQHLPDTIPCTLMKVTHAAKSSHYEHFGHVHDDCAAPLTTTSYITIHLRDMCSLVFHHLHIVDEGNERHELARERVWLGERASELRTHFFL